MSIYQSLYDNIPIGIFRTDEKGNILSANPSLVKMMGFPSEKELCTVRVFEIYLKPEDGRKVREMLNKDGMISNFETRLMRKDGSTLWGSINVRAVASDKEEVLFYEGVIEDITVRKKAETALRESEEQYRSMIDAMGEAIHVVDRDLRLILLNPSFKRWLEVLGFETDVAGKTIFEVFPFLPDKIKTEYEQVFLTGQTLVTEETNMVGGKQIITQTRKIPIVEEGRVRRVITVIEDITQSKKAVEALRESNEKYQSLVERANEGIAIVQDDVLVYVNPQLVRMLEYDDENDLQGTGVSEHIHPDVREAVMNRYRQRIQGTQVIGLYESALVTKSGLKLEVELNSETITYQEKPAVMVLLRDITERKKAEEDLKRSKERYRAVSELTSDFAYSLAVTPDGRFIPEWITEAFKRLTGLSADRIKFPQDLKNVIHPDDYPVFIKSLEILSKGEPGTCEYRILDRKGNIHYILDSARPVLDEKKNVVRIYGAAQDITDREIAEQTLRFSGAFQNLIANLSTGFVNLPIDKIDDGIKKALKVIGEFAGVDRSYVFRLHDNSTMMSNTHEWCALGIKPQMMTLKNLPLDSFPWFSARLLIGETIYCPRVSELPDEAAAERTEWEKESIKSLVNVPMLLEGRVVGFIGFDSVRTEKEWPEEILALLRIVGESFASAFERKRAEEEIRDREVKYRSLFENSGDAIILIKDGLVIDCNSKTLELFQCKRDEMVNRNPYFFSPEIQPDGFVSEGSGEVRVQSALQGNRERFYWRHVRLNATSFDAEVILSRVDVGDGKILQAVIRDITEQKQAERALRESEERYRTLTEEALVGVYIYSNSKRKYLFVNSEMSKITGYSHEELLEIDPNKLSVDEDAYLLKEREDAVMKGTLIAPEYSIRIKRKDGTVAVLSVRTHRIQYAGENVALGNCIDITELVKQRYEIERSKQEWELTFESIDDQVLILDLDRRILKANRAVVEFTGFPLRELTGKACSEVFSSGRACSTKDCPHFKCISDKETIRYEYRDSKTGRAFSVSTSPILDSRGNVAAVVEVARDITEIRDMEDALASSEAKFREMADSVRDMIFTVSYDGFISYVSPAAREILGQEPEVFAGMSILGSASNVLEHDARRLIHKLIKSPVTGERIPSFEIEARDIKGRKHTLEVVARRLHNQVVGVARDISDRKKMEQQLIRASKLASIGVLAAGIAHQVNNPLAIMLSASTVLRDLYERTPDLDEESKTKATKYFGMLENQVERTRKVVSGLLAFAQDKKLHIVKTQINSLVRESLQLLIQNFGSDRVSLELSLSDDLPEVFVDQAALQQVIVNLAQNAVEAMEGSGILSVSTQVADERNVQIVFTDTGSGVNEASREEIFEPLFTTKASSKGTGLGLPLSVMLLERFGGRIFLEKTHNKGATFVVEIPAQPEGEL